MDDGPHRCWPASWCDAAKAAAALLAVLLLLLGGGCEPHGALTAVGQKAGVMLEWRAWLPLPMVRCPVPLVQLAG